jgi:putative transposase
MHNGYQFRLYPSKEQEKILLRWIGCQRLIYNVKVQEDRYFRKFQRRMVGLVGAKPPVDQQYRHFITEQTAFLREVPSQVLRNGAVRWRQAYARFFQGLGGRPTLKERGGKQSVWLTRELFAFVPETDPNAGEVLRYHLHIGTPKFPVGVIPYNAHRPHRIPASIHISVEAGQWFVLFSAEDEAIAFPDSDPAQGIERIAENFRRMPEDPLFNRTLGADRGVAKPLTVSDGRMFDLLPIQKERIQKSRRQRTQWQRRAAWRQKGSQNQKKAYPRAARYARYEANVRWDYAHQTSHRLMASDEADLFVFEDLPIPNMTRRPKTKQDAQGHWVRNGVRAKAGLNRAILSSAWGQVVRYTEYKALRTGKLVILVPPAYSSQTCAVCGHVSPDNRPSQAAFVCLCCGHADNADRNAAVVIAVRGVQKLLSGEPLTKTRRNTRIFRSLGPERSEVTPGEISVRRLPPKAKAQRSMSQEPSGAIPETPASAL